MRLFHYKAFYYLMFFPYVHYLDKLDKTYYYQWFRKAISYYLISKNVIYVNTALLYYFPNIMLRDVNMFRLPVEFKVNIQGNSSLIINI